MNRLTIFFLFLISTNLYAAPITLGVVLDQGESVSAMNTDPRYRNFAAEVEKSIGEPVRLQYFTRAFSAIKQAREGTLDMVFGPAHVIANIIKFKYEPILKSDELISVAFVAGPNFKGSLSAKSNARLGVPDYESLIGGMARSEINSRGLSKSDFAQVRFHTIPEVPLYGLKIGSYDLAVAASDEAKKWAAANSGRVVLTGAPLPLRAMSVNSATITSATQQKLVASLKKDNGLKLVMSPATTADFKGIASMLNTTPNSLPGAKIINSAETRTMIAKGIPIYDVRLTEEYEHGHIPGSILLPYVESSAKEVDFDPAEDKFLLSQLPADKNTALIMYCDGTICWKSYKSAQMAIKAGWKNVFWFRGGFPEWKDAGLPVETRKK